MQTERGVRQRITATRREQAKRTSTSLVRHTQHITFTPQTPASEKPKGRQTRVSAHSVSVLIAIDVGVGCRLIYSGVAPLVSLRLDVRARLSSTSVITALHAAVEGNTLGCLLPPTPAHASGVPDGTASLTCGWNACSRWRWAGGHAESAGRENGGLPAQQGQATAGR